MKISQTTYDMLKADMHAIWLHRAPRVEGTPDYSALGMTNMWNLLHHAHIQRHNENHPTIKTIGRVLEYTNLDIYDLVYKQEQLDDTHLTTAFRKMIREWTYAAQPEVAKCA